MIPKTVSPKVLARRRVLLVSGALILGVVLLTWRAAHNSGGSERRIAAIRTAGEPTSLPEVATWAGSIPDAENGAPRIVELLEGVRRVDTQNIPQRGKPWTREALEWAASERVRLQPVRDGLRSALKATRFRYPIDVTNGVTRLRVPSLLLTLSGSVALAFWAEHSSALSQPSESAAALLDGIRLARTMDDEVFLTSRRGRTAGLMIIAIRTENCLTRSPLTPDGLAELQAAFLAADQPDGMTRVLVAERAYGLDAFELESSEFTATLANSGSAQRRTGESQLESVGQAVLEQVYDLGGGRGADREYYLESMEALITATRQAESVRLNAVKALDERFDHESPRWNRPRSRTLLGPIFSTAQMDQRLTTALRCAGTACAIERYRASHGGQLPARLADLVPAYLATVPLDPADQQPLRYRILDPGYVVYGLGEDGEDHQGNDRRQSGSGRTGTDDAFTVER